MKVEDRIEKGFGLLCCISSSIKPLFQRNVVESRGSQSWEGMLEGKVEDREVAIVINGVDNGGSE
jgi:hypothetical protein